jgi:hypothetical protein
MSLFPSGLGDQCCDCSPTFPPTWVKGHHPCRPFTRVIGAGLFAVAPMRGQVDELAQAEFAGS